MTHYYSAKQHSPLTISSISEILRGKKFTFWTSSGVFSKKRVDYGTRLLANVMEIRNNDRVLDIGCGIGVLGCVAATLTKNIVVLTDVNERAVFLAGKNSSEYSNVHVLHGDMYNPVASETFDVILINPPQTAGKKICFAMIEGTRAHLSSKGRLYIVARHNVGGAVLAKEMDRVFGNCETVAKKGGYRVYLSSCF